MDIVFICYNWKSRGVVNNMIDERTKKVLQTIIKHCNIINETKIFFGNNYSEFENNSI